MKNIRNFMSDLASEFARLKQVIKNFQNERQQRRAEYAELRDEHNVLKKRVESDRAAFTRMQDLCDGMRKERDAARTNLAYFQSISHSNLIRYEQYIGAGWTDDDLVRQGIIPDAVKKPVFDQLMKDYTDSVKAHVAVSMERDTLTTDNAALCAERDRESMECANMERDRDRIMKMLDVMTVRYRDLEKQYVGVGASIRASYEHFYIDPLFKAG